MKGFGNSATWHAFWVQACEDNYSCLLSYSRWLTHKTDDAEGIVHNAVCKLLKLTPNPETIEDVTKYLHGSVRHAWFDRLREKKKMRTISLDDPVNVGLRNQLPAPEGGVMNSLDNEAYRRSLKIELRRLSPRERLLLKLFLYGYGCQEIAERLEENVHLISYELNAVRTKVRQRLTKGKAKTKKSGQ